MQKEYTIKAEIYKIEPKAKKSPAWITFVLTLIPLFLGLIFWLAVVAFALVILYVLFFVI